MNDRKSDLIQGYSRGLDLSPEGLRFYERKGIVHPQRDPATGYRYYGFSDTIAATTCRKLRCWGYSLEEAADAMKNQSFEEQSDSLKVHEADFRKDLEYRKLLLKRMEESEKAVTDALSHLEEPQSAEFPFLAFLPTRIKEETIRDRSLLKQINSWNKLQPFPQIVILSRKEESMTGIAMQKEYLKLFDLPWQEEFTPGKGIFISMVQTVKDLESGGFRRKAEQILHQDLNNKVIMAVLLTASMKNEDMEILCRVLIPE